MVIRTSYSNFTSDVYPAAISDRLTCITIKRIPIDKEMIRKAVRGLSPDPFTSPHPISHHRNISVIQNMNGIHANTRTAADE